MAMNRVAESYSTQNKRNEKLRWRARRDETYNKTQRVEFLFEIACVLQLTLNHVGYCLNSSNKTVSNAPYELCLNYSIQHTFIWLKNWEIDVSFPKNKKEKFDKK